MAPFADLLAYLVREAGQPLTWGQVVVTRSDYAIWREATRTWLRIHRDDPATLDALTRPGESAPLLIIPGRTPTKGSALIVAR